VGPVELVVQMYRGQVLVPLQLAMSLRNFLSLQVIDFFSIQVVPAEMVPRVLNPLAAEQVERDLIQ
jgi:hypothetical protein